MIVHLDGRHTTSLILLATTRRLLCLPLLNSSRTLKCVVNFYDRKPEVPQSGVLCCPFAPPPLAAGVPPCFPQNDFHLSHHIQAPERRKDPSVPPRDTPLPTLRLRNKTASQIIYLSSTLWEFPMLGICFQVLGATDGGVLAASA